MSHVYCPECGFQNPVSANYCSKCGTLLVKDDGGTDTTMTFTAASTSSAPSWWPGCASR